MLFQFTLESSKILREEKRHTNSKAKQNHSSNTIILQNIIWENEPHRMLVNTSKQFLNCQLNRDECTEFVMSKYISISMDVSKRLSSYELFKRSSCHLFVFHFFFFSTITKKDSVKWVPTYKKLAVELQANMSIRWSSVRPLRKLIYL